MIDDFSFSIPFPCRQFGPARPIDAVPENSERRIGQLACSSRSGSAHHLDSDASVAVQHPRRLLTLRPHDAVPPIG
jgi:hypothetical protein